MRDLEVDHGAEGDGAAGDELGTVHHEVRVHEEHGAHAEVPLLLQESTRQIETTISSRRGSKNTWLYNYIDILLEHIWYR